MRGFMRGFDNFFFFFFFFLEEEKTEIYIQLYTGVQGLATEKMREYRKQ